MIQNLKHWVTDPGLWHSHPISEGHTMSQKMTLLHLGFLTLTLNIWPTTTVHLKKNHVIKALIQFNSI